MTHKTNHKMYLECKHQQLACAPPHRIVESRLTTHREILTNLTWHAPMLALRTDLSVAQAFSASESRDSCSDFARSDVTGSTSEGSTSSVSGVRLSDSLSSEIAFLFGKKFKADS